MPVRLLALAALLALVRAGGASAQAPAAAPAATPAVLDVGRLDGIRQAVMRLYAFDVEAMAEGLASPEGRIQGPAGTTYLYGLIAEFESPEQAAAAMRATADMVVATLADGTLSPALTMRPAADLGDAAVQLAGTSAADASAVPLTGYVVQDGAWLYLGLALGEESDAAAHDLVTFALGRPAGANAGEHRPDGSSQGGIWAKLPGSRDRALLHGTRPVADVVLHPPGDQAG